MSPPPTAFSGTIFIIVFLQTAHYQIAIDQHCPVVYLVPTHHTAGIRHPPEQMNATTTVILLFAVVLIAIVPGFKILAFFNDLVPVLPPNASLLHFLFYLIVVFGVFTLAMASTMLYADAVFPFVMLSFAEILRRSTDEKLKKKIR
ncbi:hypothetical protein Q1695_001014 [Nippostrongylus brasiliensis]|nr:hypothetical protein Q1695_001014 [Nippostrongylus brasiliensis]